MTHLLSDVLGRFAGHFSKHGAEIIGGGKANPLADLVNGYIGMSEHIEGVLDHNVVLIGNGTNSCALFEEVEEGGAADMADLAEAVDLKRLGVVAFDVCDRLLDAFVKRWA